MAENAEQKRLFTEALQKQCGDEEKERSQFLTERKYAEVCVVLEEFSQAGDASEKKAVQKEHSQVYAWAKKYELVTFQGSKILIFKGNRCACVKAKRKCNSCCHKGSTNCRNHD